MNLLKSILPSHAFFNKGSEVGPALFITDELASQREALRNVWPNARLLLCLFHYLQRWWKWLWEGNFIHRYNNLQEMTISTPSINIASALHTFSTEGKANSTLEHFYY